MFGYISPDVPHLFVKDERLYKALYCGMCRSIGASCGQIAKTTLSYDIAFMSALLHNIKNVDVKIKNRQCYFHIKKMPMAEIDEITLALGCVNTVLAYYKLKDDQMDGDKRGVFSFLYKGGYKRALKKHPEIVNICRRQVEAQAELEKNGCSSIDMASEPTANMLRELAHYLLGEYATEHTDMLLYDVGKWIYLADAMDDYDKDVKKGRYNVLYNLSKAQTFSQGRELFGEELLFVLNSLFADMRNRLANIKFNYNHDLTDNIILRGIPTKSRFLYYGMTDRQMSQNKD